MKNYILISATVLIAILAPSASASTIFITSRDAGGADLYQFGLNGSLLQTIPGNGLVNGQGVVVGPNGRVFVANEGGSVLTYNPTTGAFLSTFASGLGSAGPLAFGPDGNLYVGAGSVVKKLNGSTGALISSIGAGTGLTDVSGVTFDGSGNLYVADGVTGNIEKFDSTGTFLSTIVTGNAALSNGAGDLLYTGAHLLVAATFAPAGSPGWGHSILAFGTDGTALPNFATDSHLNGPNGMAFGPDGNLYVVNYAGGNVVRFSSAGAFIDTFIAANPPAGRGVAFALDAPVNGVPEPATFAMLGGGLLALVVAKRRKAAVRKLSVS